MRRTGPRTRALLPSSQRVKCEQSLHAQTASKKNVSPDPQMPTLTAADLAKHITLPFQFNCSGSEKKCLDVLTLEKCSNNNDCKRTREKLCTCPHRWKTSPQ
jgi:hypothetical protein